MADAEPDFTWLPDLALRTPGGAAVRVNDDTLAEENLINPGPASCRPASFGRLDIYPDGGMARLRRFGRLA